jgi:hypothetical protein
MLVVTAVSPGEGNGMKRAVLWGTLWVVASAVVACNSPRDASKSTFKNAINAHFEKHCIQLKKVFPAYVPVASTAKSEVQRANYAQQYGKEIAGYDALVGAGILTVSDGVEEVHGFFGPASKRPARIYALTETGKKLYSEERTAFFATGVLCVGTSGVDSIGSYSEPAQALGGVTVSHVVYTYSPRKVNDWARDRKVQEALPELKELLAPHKSDRATLVLMNTGWVHESDATVR